ncbi:hypothetical protein KUV73_20410 [Mameliella alba]|nr:hypothetical protein [Mameliella alba]MBY6171522.1 hypothetical protein [Mameliella alba]MBY6176746.1 hypothetical protein [Mameliella alba]
MTRFPDKLDDAHGVINEAANLTDALQILLWDIVNMSEGEPIRRRQRDALVGLGNALERVLNEGAA